MKADRRQRTRFNADRRKSQRWQLHKSLNWRVPRGRRLRRSVIVERSLNGVVLRASTRDAVPSGTRMLVTGSTRTFDRLGFRSIVVQRTEACKHGGRILFAEIEA